MQKYKDIQAYTLLELITVIVMISILAAIAVPNFLHYQIRAKRAKAIADLAITSSALEYYFCDFTAYPPNILDFKNVHKITDISSATIFLKGLKFNLKGNILNPEKEDSKFYTHHRISAINSVTLHRLTTPVSYIRKEYNDPFFNDKIIEGVYMDAYNMALYSKHPYRYINYEEIHEEGITLKGRNISYLLWSTGPDKTSLFNFHNPETIIDYDPTNGMISHGDIIVYGPVN
jgi:prepilin-type N-terminal cleavage/methylation domain-containing protein